MGKYIAKIISLLIFLAGILNIYSVLFVYHRHPSLSFQEALLPPEIVSISRTFTLLIGVFLLYLARALWQRKRRAWGLSLFLLFTSFFSHLFKGADIEDLLFLSIPFILLIYFRSLYTIQSTRITFSDSFKTSLSVLFFLFVYSFLGYYLFQEKFHQTVTPQAIAQDYLYNVFGLGKDVLTPTNRMARWFEDSLSIVGISAIILEIGVIFAPLLEKEKPTEEEKELARQLVFKYGYNPLASLALMDDKNYFFAQNRKCFIAYKMSGGVAVALGDPIGEKRQLKNCLLEFTGEMNNRGITPAFVGCLQNYESTYQSCGYKYHKVGENAIILTDKFSLEGPQNSDSRHAVTRMEREGVTYEWYTFDQIPWRVTKDLDNLHRAWLNSKKGPAGTFSTDFYPLPVYTEGRLMAVYSQSKKLIAALTFFPYKNKEAQTSELLIRDQKAPNGIMEASIAQAIFHFKEEEVKEVNLGMTLLINTDDDSFALKAVDRLATIMKLFFDYKALHLFKKRFNPSWQNTYLAYRSINDLPKVTLAVLAVNLKDQNIARVFANKYFKRSSV